MLLNLNSLMQSEVLPVCSEEEKQEIQELLTGSEQSVHSREPSSVVNTTFDP